MRHALIALVLLLAGCLGGTGDPPVDDAEPEPVPTIQFQAALFETDLGDITLILYPRYAPSTVTNFQRLVRDGYYDGMPWHRVVDDFVIQTGEGDDAATVPLETHDDTYFSGGALGIARGEDPGSGGPQFFITEHAQPHLKWPNGTASEAYGAFTMFGQVLDGMDVVHRIAAVPVVPGLDRPVTEVLTQRASLTVLNLTASEAQALPLRTTDRQVSGGYRITFEYPANLEAGSRSNVTWYAAPRELPATGPLDDPVMEAEGPNGERMTFGITRDDHDPGVLRAQARFDMPGEWWVRLLDGDTVMSGFAIDVPRGASPVEQ